MFMARLRLAENTEKSGEGKGGRLTPLGARYNFCTNAAEMEADMQAVKVRKIGNSLGVVIPKEVLARMQVGEGETLYLTEAADGGVRLTPMDESFAEEFAAQMEAAEKVMRADRHILRELAKR